MTSTATRWGASSRKALGFVVIPVVGTVAPFAFLPLLSRSGGVEVWAAVGVGHSVGNVVAMVIGRGWSLTGPALVVQSCGAWSLYQTAIWSRCRSLMLATPVASVIAAGLALDQWWMAAAVAASSSLVGLRSDWFFVGLGRPLPILLGETIPRVLPLLLGAAIYWYVPWSWIYPAALGAGSVLATWFTYLMVRRTAPRTSDTQWPVPPPSAVAADVAATLYSTGSVAVVSLSASTAAVATYSAGDRIYKLALLGVSAVTQTLQSWVLRGGEEQVRRIRQAFALHAVMAVVGIAGAVALGPLMTGLVFGADFEISVTAALMFGIALAAVSVNTAMARYVLAPNGQTAPVFTSTAVASLVGVPLTGILAASWGAVGGATGLAVSQVLVCLLQVRPVRSVMNTMK